MKASHYLFFASPIFIVMLASLPHIEAIIDSGRWASSCYIAAITSATIVLLWLINASIDASFHVRKHGGSGK